jgi:hypothetical protein
MIYAIHEHELKPDADEVAYERDVAAALAQMKVPGLLHAHHLKGVRGERSGKYAVLWVFANEAALVENFGPPDNRKWPADWLHYENVILARYLDRHPDTIDYTDYRPLQEYSYERL